MRQTSFRILSCVLGVAILLLALSYIIIQRDLRRREAGERKLKEIIGQNRDLLDMRKKIILTISHDIRAPLSIINGSAELAMGHARPQETQQPSDQYRRALQAYPAPAEQPLGRVPSQRGERDPQRHPFPAFRPAGTHRGGIHPAPPTTKGFSFSAISRAWTLRSAATATASSRSRTTCSRTPSSSPGREASASPPATKTGRSC